MTLIFVGEKAKKTNKGTDKQYVADDSFLHSTTCHIRYLYKNKILSQVVSEKCLTEKKFTNKHSNIKSKNYIPPIQFAYRGYK